MAQDFQARFHAAGGMIDHTPGTAVAAGEVVVIGSMVAIAKNPIAANALGALATSGIFWGVKVNGAITAGDALYWDADGDPQGGTAGSGAFTTTASGNTYAGPALADAGATDETVKFELRRTDVVNAGLANAIADPGDGNDIDVTRSGTCPLVTAGAETRGLPDPTFAGQHIALGFKTDGGDCVVTAATAINQAGNNTLTFADAGDIWVAVAIDVGGNLLWREIANDGVALSTV